MQNTEDFIAKLWAPAASGVEVGSPAALGASHLEERLLAIGRPASIRFLASPGPLHAALTGHPGLRGRRVRASRRLAALAVDLGIARSGLMCTQFGIAIPPGSDPNEVVLHRAIAFAAGLPSSRVFLAMRPVDDHYKPTIALLSDTGTAVAFAKVGWSTPTARVVSHESVALADITGKLGPGLTTPRLLATGHHFDRPFFVTEPLPDRAQKLGREVPPASVMTALAGLVRTVPASTVTDGLISTVLAGPPSSRQDLLRATVDRLRERWSTGVEVCRAHGDWVPWNTAAQDGVIFAWDWEHYSPASPTGFDAFHWVVLSSQHLDGVSWQAAYDHAVSFVVDSRIVSSRSAGLELAAFHAATLLARAENLRTPSGVEPYPIDDVLGRLVQQMAGSVGG